MNNKIFELKGKTLAIIDWANVYGWSKKLKWEVEPQKLFNYLKSYPEIYDIRFYFGKELGNEKSENFQQEIKDIGYTLISKEVKWVPVSLEKSHFKNLLQELVTISDNLKNSNSKISNQLKELLKTPIYRRKCDFDCEIVLDIMQHINDFDGMLLFSGDGDYKAIAEYLLNKRKQVIVVHPYGLRGREYNELLIRDANKPYLCAVEKLTSFLKNLPE